MRLTPSTPTRRPARLLALLAATTAGLVLPAAPAQAATGNLSVSVTAPASVERGNRVTLSVGLRHGAGDAPVSATVTVTLPAGLELDAVTPGEGVTCQQLRCTVTLAPFASARVSVDAYAVAAGDQVVTAAVEQGTPDPEPADDTASVTVPVAPGDGLQLVLRPLPMPLAYGQLVELQGRALRADGTPTPDGQHRVALQTRVPGTEGSPWTTGGGLFADEAGSFALEVPTDRAVDVRVVIEQPRVYSAVVQVRPVVRPGLVLDPVRLPPGGSGRALVSLAGPVAGRTVSLQRAGSAGWQTIATRDVTRPGTVAVPLSRLAAGSYRFRAVVSGTDTAPGREVVLPVSLKGYGDGRAYRFLNIRNGQPVRWDPCTTITWRVNPRNAPAGGVADAHEAVRRLVQVTGLPFRYGGTTAEVPGGTPRQTTQFVVAWATNRQTYLFGSSGHPNGVGGFEARGTSTGLGKAYQGYVVLDSTKRFRAGFGAGATEGALLLHELAHAVGLGHVESRLQLMTPALDPDLPVAMWGAGDLNGLSRLGRTQGCLR